MNPFKCRRCSKAHERNGSVMLRFGLKMHRVCVGCSLVLRQKIRTKPVEHAYDGIDARYQIDRRTFVGGEFSRLGIGRYVEAA